jgi:hypothetical protein
MTAPLGVDRRCNLSGVTNPSNMELDACRSGFIRGRQTGPWIRVLGIVGFLDKGDSDLEA